MFSDPRAIASMAFEQRPSLPQALPSVFQSVNETRENFKVVIRLRPPLPREIDSVFGFRSIVEVTENNKRVTIEEYQGHADNAKDREADILANPGLVTYHHFSFDFIYGPTATQQEVYERTARPAVLSILEGYNATILAFGQTGTGKTFTMEGFKYNASDPQRGICPRACEEFFKAIEGKANNTFMVRASYLQIYNESISDLLKGDRQTLQIREERRKGVYVDGLSEWAVRSPHDIFALMRKGQHTRCTAATNMNDLSSRSHAVFILVVEQMGTVEEGKAVKVGKLNFVDLAGSERVRVSGATGQRLEESKKINQSLSALGNVISALTDVKNRSHIPYRDSKLTRILEDSLGGNCRTTMIAMISPAFESFGESLSTLKFANRAKHIKNSPKVNEDLDQKTLLRKYELELKRLRSELETRSKSMIDKEQLLKLEESRRQAEADKEAAVQALEERSREILFEKEEKQRLEELINAMDSQLLEGGKPLEETPQFLTALEARHKEIREDYEARLVEIERERQLIEEDKAQIDQYKQLLLRQRDIMIALTARLNERDETILQLHEELEAFDRLHRDYEQQFANKLLHCEQLEAMLRGQGLEVPVNQAEPVHSKNLRRYEPLTPVQFAEDAFMPLQMLTAEEKIAELSQLLQKQQSEREQVVPSPPKEVLEFVEGLYFGISNDAFDKTELLAEVQKLYNHLNQASPRARPTPRKAMTVEEMLQAKRATPN